jgi:hypothetical protein
MWELKLCQKKLKERLKRKLWRILNLKRYMEMIGQVHNLPLYLGDRAPLQLNMRLDVPQSRYGLPEERKISCL